MLSCARSAISRALRLNVLSSSSRPCTPRLSREIHSRVSAPLSLATTVGAKGQIRIPRRNFSTSPLQQQYSSPEILADVFPICCPGCGAFSQTVEPDEPGYYNLERKQTRKLLASKRDAMANEASESLDVAEDLQQQDAVTEEGAAPQPNQGRSFFRRALRGIY